MTAYENMLSYYIDLVNKTETPESLRHSGAMRAFYDNCSEDEEIAIALHKTVLDSIEDCFRHNPFKERRIKNKLLSVLKTFISDTDEAKSEVKRIYNIVVEQGEY